MKRLTEYVMISSVSMIKWQRKISVDKCKIMLTGKTNYNLTYEIKGSKLAITTEETLEVRIDISMKILA